MTRSEIASEVVTNNDHRGAGNPTNREKFHFICHTFNVQGIALAAHFDYDDAIASGDLQAIEASLYLSTLQFEFWTRCHLHNLVRDDEYQTQMAYLTLAMSKMRWAYSFMQYGKEPPPYPFVN